MACLKPLYMLRSSRDCALKLLEESREAYEATKKYAKVHSERTRLDTLLELADVAQCMCNCLHALGSSPSEWEDAVATVKERNEDRGHYGVCGANALTVDWGDNG